MVKIEYNKYNIKIYFFNKQITVFNEIGFNSSECVMIFIVYLFLEISIFNSI